MPLFKRRALAVGIVSADELVQSAIIRTRQDDAMWRLRNKRLAVEREAALTERHKPFCGESIALLGELRDWIEHHHLREPHRMNRQVRFTFTYVPEQISCDWGNSLYYHFLRLMESGKWAIWQHTGFSSSDRSRMILEETGEFWNILRQLPPASILDAAEREFRRYGVPLP